MRRLNYGWGNERYAAPPDYLGSVWQAAHQTAGPVLECGSGLSSLVLGMIGERRGIRTWSFEHDGGWAEETRRALRQFRIGHVDVLCTPLRDYGDFEWYGEIPWGSSDLPSAFALVVCDGPPGPTTLGGRVGLLHVMRERLSPACLILVDDLDREEDREIANRWACELGTTLEIRGDEKPFAVLRRDQRDGRSG